MNNQNFQKSEEYEAYEPWLGKSTLLASGPRWHKLRKLVTPGFHFSILENFIPIFEEHAMTLTNKYKMIGNKCVDVFPINALFTADVIAGNTLLNPQSNQFIFYCLSQKLQWEQESMPKHQKLSTQLLSMSMFLPT